VVGAVGRRLVPYLVEATLIPTAIFYALLATTGELRWALLGALAWSYAAVARRWFGGRAIPGLLILATLGISVRTGIYLWSNNSFVYFVQPILRTVLTGALFAGSVAAGRPLIGRFADDFCPLAPDVQRRPAVLRLFRRLTLLWAGMNGLMAAASLALLLTVPVPLFVVSATVSAWIVTGSGVLVTVIDAVGTARREGLVTALAPNGTLYAATTHPALV
jgi:intracellular septation protein A